MLSQDIRRQFLSYFKKEGHRLVPSSPVFPYDDPTLLFTNAGMNQFKDVFLGKSVRDYTRATTAQKCIRVGGKHNDLENVGHTSRHLTFFEMLGNFSFGDYFKKQAITFAWDVTLEVFQFDPNKIWATVFREDDEAFELWKQLLPENRIVRMDEKDNFWAMGDTGPCGPCSELYYDRGPKYGTAASIQTDVTGERFLEFWNLVFIQMNRTSSDQLHPLQKKSIDTGAGLERIVSLKMDVPDLFGTDILRALIQKIENVSHQTYPNDHTEMSAAFRVIADHLRTLAFAIADGVQPSNIERGYVLRKVLRRSVRYGKLLGFQGPFLAKILPTLIECMGSDYPEIQTSQTHIEEILTLEEESFLRTLKKGGNILQSTIEKASLRDSKQITGDEAFKLKDTYGLPIDEVKLIAKDSNLSIDLESYEVLEQEAKERSKAARSNQQNPNQKNLYQDYVLHHPPVKFIGYTHLSCEAVIQGIVVEGKLVSKTVPGQEISIIFDQTPFYAEKGGQVGDTGKISYKEQTESIIDCKTPYPGIIIHRFLAKGILQVGEKVTLIVDGQRRQVIQNNHTATHLLHWALIQVLGSHIRQAGSIVDSSKLRFDFNHHKALSKEEIQKIEDLINEKIRNNTTVKSYEMDYEAAQKRKDIHQLFGEKYEAQVRVIDIDYSKELCGGTHTSLTGNIGYFRITSESSISAGVRRIEARTGHEAESFVRKQEKDWGNQAQLYIEELKKSEQALKTARRSALKDLASQLIQQKKSFGSHFFLSALVSIEGEELGFLAEELYQQSSSTVLLLACRKDNRCQVILRIPSDLVQKGMNAATILKEVSPLINGSGGGRPEAAQAGGKSPENLEKLFIKVRDIFCAAQ